MLENLLQRYGLPLTASVVPFGTGLINKTWVITHDAKKYILQKVNTQVFKNPEGIAGNIESISNYLQVNYPEYLFVTPVKTIEGESMVNTGEEGYFRLFPFINGSHTIDVVNHPDQAYQAAKQFALFTKNLHSFPAKSLSITLPDFHNLSMRYDQFLNACQTGNPERISAARDEIAFLKLHQQVVTRYKEITASPSFKLRVTHHDTKISNVLFDQNNKGLCVIDLDTMMPGYFISDTGDMMRTYLSPVSEEEKDFSKIQIREDYFKAILEGYLSEMAGELTPEEVESFVYSGVFMIYMQAARFLTDHLNNDIYYGAAYPGHNLKRAQNQICLLQELMKKQPILDEMVRSVTASLIIQPA